jgi:hypothetical protein
MGPDVQVFVQAAVAILYRKRPVQFAVWVFVQHPVVSMPGGPVV